MKHIKIAEKIVNRTNMSGNSCIKTLCWNYTYDNARNVIRNIPYFIEVFSLRNILDQLHSDIYKKLSQNIYVKERLDQYLNKKQLNM